MKAWVRGSGLESWRCCLPVPSYQEMSFGKLSQVTVQVFSDLFHQQYWACSRHTSSVRRPFNFTLTQSSSQSSTSSSGAAELTRVLRTAIRTPPPFPPLSFLYTLYKIGRISELDTEGSSQVSVPNITSSFRRCSRFGISALFAFADWNFTFWTQSDLSFHLSC